MVELREALVHSNVSFATEITDMQEDINIGINKIIDTIAEIKGLGFKPSKYIEVTVIPPVILILQLIEMTLSAIGNISGTFTNMGVAIDPYYFLEQYVPHINWDKFRDASKQKIIVDKTREQMKLADQSTSPNTGF